MSSDINKYFNRFLFQPKSQVLSQLFGAYKTAFKGSGQIYLQSRLYEEGDDARYIDSRVTARNIEIHTKVFTEERLQDVVIVFDVSPSVFVSFDKNSNNKLLENIVLLLSNIVLSNGDKLGYIAFSDKVESYSVPQNNPSIIYQIDKVVNEKVRNTQTNISSALEFLYKSFKKNTLVFIISDFFAENYYDLLKLVCTKFDTIVVNLEQTSILCDKAIFLVKDSETGRITYIDTNKITNDIPHKKISSYAKELSVDYIETSSTDDFIKKLFLIMKRRVFHLKNT
ncbi:MAG: DUF58 domain-containing protein [Bacteroidota bacterium]